MGSEVKDITEDLPFEIPDSWVWVRHNEIFEISGGSQPPKSKFISQPKTGYVRLYQIRDYGSNPQPIYIPENTASKVSKKGDILLARYGASLGKVFWAEDGAYNVAMARIIALFDIALINKHYLYYYYKSSIYQETIMGNARSAQAGFNKDDLSKMFFPLPPLTEQARIVAEIEKIDPLIAEYDKLEQQATKLDEEIYDKLKKSILQYAIQGKLVPQDPNDEPASVLLERIRAEKRAKLGKKYVDSYIYKGDDNCYYEKVGTNEPVRLDNLTFDIPDSWCWARLGSIGDWGAGATPARTNSQYYGGNIPWLKTGELNNDTVYDSEEHITDDALQNCSLRYCHIGDVLIAMYGATIGKLAIAGVPLTTNQACCACTPYEGIYNLYLFYFLMEERDNFIQMGFGGAQPNISKEKIIKHLFPVPPYEEQKRIVSTFIEIQNKLKDEDYEANPKDWTKI